MFHNGTSEQKKKAEKAEEILNSIYSIKFALTLAVLIDVYRIYSQIAVLLQKVSTLPHTRYDQFKELLEDYKEMLAHVEIGVCPCSTFRDIQAGVYKIPKEYEEEAALVCSWPTFHGDISTLSLILEPPSLPYSIINHPPSSVLPVPASTTCENHIIIM